MATFLKPKRTKKKKTGGCLVCRCTERRACHGSCAWSEIVPGVCTRCASGRPFEAIEAVPFNCWVVLGPGKVMESLQQVPFDSSYRLPREAARKLTGLLNEAYQAGAKSMRERAGLLPAPRIKPEGREAHQQAFRVEFGSRRYGPLGLAEARRLAKVILIATKLGLRLREARRKR